jgi:hypothetical protein
VGIINKNLEWLNNNLQVLPKNHHKQQLKSTWIKTREIEKEKKKGEGEESIKVNRDRMKNQGVENWKVEMLCWKLNGKMTVVSFKLKIWPQSIFYN